MCETTGTGHWEKLKSCQEFLHSRREAVDVLILRSPCCSIVSKLGVHALYGIKLKFVWVTLLKEQLSIHVETEEYIE